MRTECHANRKGVSSKFARHNIGLMRDAAATFSGSSNPCSPMRYEQYADAVAVPLLIISQSTVIATYVL